MPATRDTANHDRRRVGGYVDPRVERSRQLIIDTAADLLGDGDLDAVTFEAVSAAARVARSTIYRHFSDRTDLLAAAFDRLLPPLQAPPPGPFVDRVCDIAVQFARSLAAPWALALPGWLATLGRTPPGASGPLPVTALRERLIARQRAPLRAVLDEGVARGQLAADTDVDLIAAEILGPLLFRALVTGETVDDDVARAVARDTLGAHQIGGESGGRTNGTPPHVPG